MATYKIQYDACVGGYIVRKKVFPFMWVYQSHARTEDGAKAIIKLLQQPPVIMEDTNA